jgi:hypothetical protein
MIAGRAADETAEVFSMLNLTVTDQFMGLRTAVFGALESWNAAHPHPLPARKEHAAINVTAAYTGAAGEPSYMITVVCTLLGSAPLAFHGPDLVAVAEQARLALERRIGAEVEGRAVKSREDARRRELGIAV